MLLSKEGELKLEWINFKKTLGWSVRPITGKESQRHGKKACQLMRHSGENLLRGAKGIAGTFQNTKGRGCRLQRTTRTAEEKILSRKVDPGRGRNK